MVPIRLTGNLLKVFKILNGFDNIDRKHFHVYLRSTLREHRCKLDIRKFTFSNCVIDSWNSLPPVVALLILLKIVSISIG